MEIFWRKPWDKVSYCIPSGSQHGSKKECRQDIHSGFETHEEGHTKSKTGAISGSTKWTLVQTKNFLKKKKKKGFVLYPEVQICQIFVFGGGGRGSKVALFKSQLLKSRSAKEYQLFPGWSNLAILARTFWYTVSAGCFTVVSRRLEETKKSSHSRIGFQSILGGPNYDEQTLSILRFHAEKLFVWANQRFHQREATVIPARSISMSLFAQLTSAYQLIFFAFRTFALHHFFPM